MIQLSPAAIGEVKRLRAKHCKSGVGILRIGIQAGGCFDWSYQLEFTPAPQAQDQVFTCGDIQVAVDPESLPYVSELALDYTEDLMGGGFQFQNPQASEVCSCGYSFSTKLSHSPLE